MRLGDLTALRCRVAQRNHPATKLGPVLLTLVIGDSSVLCMELVDKLLEVFLEARR